jgi:hypothetical protein
VFARHAAAACLVSSLSISSALGCSPSDIAVKQADWHKTTDAGQGRTFVEIVGEITNNCAEPAAAEVQATFRDRSDKVVAVDEFWPASTRNIAAHASYPFSRTNIIDASAYTMSVSVIDTRKW